MQNEKRIAVAAAFAACLPLCAAVWTQNEPVEETPAEPTRPNVTVTHPNVPEIPKIKESTMPEEKKIEATEPEQTEEAIPPQSQRQLRHL